MLVSVFSLPHMNTQGTAFCPVRNCMRPVKLKTFGHKYLWPSTWGLALAISSQIRKLESHLLCSQCLTDSKRSWLDWAPSANINNLPILACTLIWSYNFPIKCAHLPNQCIQRRLVVFRSILGETQLRHFRLGSMDPSWSCESGTVLSHHGTSTWFRASDLVTPGLCSCLRALCVLCSRHLIYAPQLHLPQKLFLAFQFSFSGGYVILSENTQTWYPEFYLICSTCPVF